MTTIDYGDFIDEDLIQADYYASFTLLCPICDNQLDHCGSGHHSNCPINESIYVPRN